MKLCGANSGGFDNEANMCQPVCQEEAARMKKAVLFGAGEDVKKVVKYINYRHIKVVAAVDNDKNKWGKKIRNVKIFNPCILKKIQCDFILITSSRYWEEIKAELAGMQITNVLPVFSTQLDAGEKRIFSYCLNQYGKCVLRYRNLCIRQEFYPSFVGIATNPYFFARNGLLKYIQENKDYISGRCLDFGCGIKPYEQIFQATEYIGVEIEAEEKRPGIVYYDGKTLPFEDGYFDCVISSQVFEHIPNLGEILLEIRRALKPGGYILLTVPFVYPEHLKPYDFRRFTSYGIKLILEEEGFEIIKLQKSGNFIETVTQMDNVYFNEKIFCGKKYKILKRVGVCAINLKGYVLSKILKDSNELYLDIIVVARKK